MRKRFFVILLVSLFPISGLVAQTPALPFTNPSGNNKPVVNMPTVPASTNRHNPHDRAAITDIQQRNAAIMREVQEHEHLMAEVRRQENILTLTNSGFPSLSDNEGTDCYYAAFDEINRMLEGEAPMDLGRAVFLVENAYHNNKYDYADYRNGIKEAVGICNQIMEYEKLNKEDNTSKNMTLFRYISDTLVWKDKKTGKNLYHYPVQYNYEDYASKISYDSHFVTTLMQKGKGQCHNMPLYFLVLAEEMGAEAYRAFSPKHTFVKIQDEKGTWYNLELTCNAILSDAHYMNSSYIKAEAIQNRIYLEPMDKTNTVAEMMVDLARGYYKKYGLDDFYLQCVNTAVQYLDNKLSPLMLEAEYETRLTLTLAHLLQAPHPDMMKEKSPEAYRHYERMQALYRQIDDLGYEELPEEIYADWLKYIAKEKERSEKLPSIFIRQRKER